MRAFLALAGTTTMRKGEILSLRWDRVDTEDAPYATLVVTSKHFISELESGRCGSL